MRIICFTGSRAEYYLLRPLLSAIKEKNDYEIFLIISGGILEEKEKQTIKDIKRDKINICGEIKLKDLKSNHSNAIGQICIEASNYINKIHPDLSIVYADRYESFGFAIAASHSNIPLLHIEAGDITDGGTYDDQIRHCISKLSHIFCTSTLKGTETLFRLGEERWRCIQSGLLSYEDMQNITIEDRKSIIKELKIEKNIPIILATMHPIPRDLELTNFEMREFLEGLRNFSNTVKSKIIITSPNNDIGCDIISKLIKEYIVLIKNGIYFESLGGKRYHSLMSLAKTTRIIVCGNSSSVIKEAPYYGAHSLNIGIRQSGRESASTQINCSADRKSISEKLKYLSTKDCFIGTNPYLMENPSKRIIEFIENIFIKKTYKEIMFKKWAE